MAKTKKGAAGALIIAGLTLLLLTISGYVLTFARLAYVQSRLETAANAIAAVGSLNLLSPSTVCESMRDTFIGLFPDDGASLGIAADESIVLRLTFYSGLNGSTGEQSTVYTVPKTGACDLAGAISLPLSRIKIEVTGRFSLSSIVPVASLIGSSRLTTILTSESFAQLAPMDVVLLIDNSNSVISPIESSIDFDSEGFDDYASEVVGTTADSRTTKRAIYAGACFGYVNIRLKRAAVKLYDILTSVSSNRVGVAYTNPGWGEVAGLAIKLDQSPWERVEAAEEGTVMPEPVVSPPGAIDSYSTRCAAITDDFALPEHPFVPTWLVAEDFYPENGDLSGKLVCTKRSSCSSELFHNRLNSAETGLLPREIIWTANAGLFSSSGTLLPQGNVNLVQSVLERIYQELALNNYIPESDDETETRTSPRKLIIYLTDGVDVVPNGLVKPLPEPLRADQKTTINPLITNGELPEITYSVQSLTEPRPSPTPVWSGLQQVPCLVQRPNEDFSLGVLYFHFRTEDGSKIEDLPYSFQAPYYLAGHTYADETLLKPNALMDDWRTNCQSGAGPGHGTFLLESSALEQENADKFVDEIIPALLRTVMLPKIN